MATTLLIKELLEAGVHFGHQTKRWNPKMRRYIFGERSGIYIIDLEQTESILIAACDFLRGATTRGERILFVGTKRQAQATIRELARQIGMPFVANRWLGGTLTNFSTIRTSVARLRHLRAWRDEGRFAQLSKKEAARLTKELGRLEYNREGIADMERLPGALVVIDPHREAIAVREANRLKIPVVAVWDTNCDPDLVTYAVPGNDDAMRAIRLLIGRMVEACLAGRQLAEAVQPVAPAAEAPAAAIPAVELPVGPVTVDVLSERAVLPPLVEKLEVSPEPSPPKAKRATRPRSTKRPPAGP